MSRRSVVPWLLVLLTALTLYETLGGLWAGAAFQPLDLRYFIIMAGFIAFIVNVYMPLQGDALSLGYGAGLLAYLTLSDPQQVYMAFSAITLGSVGGGLLRAGWHWRQATLNPTGPTPPLRVWVEWIELPLTATSQMVLSIAAGHIMYALAGGQLPIRRLSFADAIPLFLVIAVSGVAYLALYSALLWWRKKNAFEIFAENARIIALTVFLPTPLIIAAALLFTTSPGGFVLMAVGLMVMAIGATALGRAYLQFRYQLIELQSLSAVNRAMRTALDLDALLSTIHVQVATLLNIQNFTLALYEPVQNIVTFPLAVENWQRKQVAPHELGMDLIDHVIAKQSPLLLAETPTLKAETMGLVAPAKHLTSWLGVPLLAPDRALGCIAVSLDETGRHFTERDQRLLVAVATQSSVAIENAQLYRQVQERASQLTRLNNLSAQLSGTLDPQRVLDIAVESMGIVSGSAGAAVFLWWDDARKSMGLARSWKLSGSFVANPPLPLTKDKSAQPLVVQNVRLDPKASAICDAMEREGIYAWIELPLSDGQQEIGVLIGYYRSPRRFSGDEIELLKTFSNEAGLAISNAGRYHQTDVALARRVEQLSALASINKELSSTLSLDKVFNLVLDRAIEATGSTHGILLINDAKDSAPRIVANRGNSQLPITELMDHGAVNEAYTTGKPTLSTVRPDGSLSQLGVPIVRNDTVLGVIMLISHELTAYRQDDISFVSQLATQATIAMDNARLFGWMKDNRNRLQVILDSMHEAVIMFELDGRVDLANPRVEMLLNIDPILIARESLGSLLARPNLDFAARLGFDNGSLEALFKDVRAGKWQSSGRHSYNLNREKLYFIDRMIVLVLDQEDQPIGVLMVFTDATEERELTQAREDLSRMIVHDLRSPLTAINTSMKLLNEMVSPDHSLGSSVQKTTEVSQRAVRKLLYLVDSLLDIAKMESGTITLETENCSLRVLAENVRAELMPLAEELDIRIELGVANDVPSLMIDGQKIERVLLNLVDNALKFAPVGGLVQIRARREQLDRVRVEVADNGPGVPDDYKKRIFDRYQQADQRGSHRRGTGLGLTFCKLAVEAHGGTIWIEDNPGGGSVFVFTLLSGHRQSMPLRQGG